MPRTNKARSIGAEDVLAARIARERTARGWSYETMADAMRGIGCSLSGSSIYKIEKGSPRRAISVDELVAVSRLWSIPLDVLLEPNALALR